MNAKDFTNELISTYQKNTGRELSYEDLGLYICEILESKSDFYSNSIKKNTAARIIHEFMKHALNLKDLDWGKAACFHDIYDCKVCANSLAQCYVRGIIIAQNDMLIGGDDILENPENVICRFCLFLESHQE